MSRHRVTDAIDSLLGTSSPRGDLVHTIKSGVHTNFDPPNVPEPNFDHCSRHGHGRLHDDRRCTGCGRTRNEIEIDEGS